MDKRYLLLREKMGRYNTWEIEEQIKLSELDRLKQFFILYDLGQMHSKNTIQQAHDAHLKCLIKTNKRLKTANKV